MYRNLNRRIEKFGVPQTEQTKWTKTIYKLVVPLRPITNKTLRAIIKFWYCRSIRCKNTVLWYYKTYNQNRDSRTETVIFGFSSEFFFIFWFWNSGFGIWIHFSGNTRKCFFLISVIPKKLPLISFSCIY